jgi:S-layer protein
MAIPTNGIQLVRIAGAVFNQRLSATDYSEILTANKSASDLAAWANAAVAAEFKNKTTTDVAAALLTNVGLSSVAGLQNWVVGQLNAGGGMANAGSTILGMLNDFSNMSTTDGTYGSAVLTFNTKVANAQTQSQTAGTTTSTYAAVSSTVAPTVTNATFTLTTGADTTLVGGAGDDVFNGNISATASVLTATTGDVLSGGAGTDTLNLTVVDAANPGLLQTSGIENVTVKALGATTINALLINGYNNLTANGGTSAVTVDNAAIAATHSVTNSISGNAADLTVNFRGVEVTGAADVAKFSIENVGSSVVAAGATSATVTNVTLTAGTGAEQISLSTKGTNYTTVNGQVTTESLSISGDGTNAITVGTLKPAALVDASASTGTNTIAMGSLKTGQTIKGGSGTDTVTFTASETSSVTMSGVETLQVGGGTSTTTFTANPALTSLNVRSASDAITMNGISTLSNINYQGTAVATYAGTSANVTLNTAFSGTADSVAVSIGNRGTLANGSYNMGTLAVSGVETVTITQSNMLATGTTTIGLVDTGLRSLTVTTPGNLTIGSLDTRASTSAFPATFTGTASTTGSNSITSLDLSGVTGSVGPFTFQAGTFAAAATIKASVGGTALTTSTETASDVITFTGGAGVDSLTTGTAGTYVVDLGEGSTNTFNGGALVAAVSGNTANVTGGAGADTITTGANADTINGGAGDDIITGGLGADVINGGSGSDTYRVAVGVAAANATAEVQTITVTHGTTGGTTSAQNLVVTILGTSVNVVLPADAGAGQTPTTEAASIASALNSIAAGRFVATSALGVVSVTYAESQGDAATLSMKATVNGTASTEAVSNVTTATTDLSTYTIATGTTGALATLRTDSDSTQDNPDFLTYVSGADVIDVVAGNIVITGGDAVTAAAAGNANISAAGLATFHANDTTLAQKLTAVAADLDAVAAVREAAVFVHNGQGYMFISDGVAGLTSSDAVIVLTGVTTIATGMTLTGGNVTAIA